MSPWSVLQEAARSAWANKVSSVLVALVVGGMCFAALNTVGRNAANQAALEAAFDSQGARSLTITESGSQGFLNTATLQAVSNLDQVAKVGGLGTTIDVVNGAITGTPLVPLRPLRGDWHQLAPLQTGRMPQPGEAIIGIDALQTLRMEQASGFVATKAGRQFPVVGAFKAAAPFDDLNNGLITPSDESDALLQMRVLVTSFQDLSATQSAISRIMGAQDPTTMTVESGRSLVEQSFTVTHVAAGFGRTSFLLILAIGALFVGAVVFSDVLIRRRDLGRRRALGCSRSALVQIVVAHATTAAIFGALLGSTISVTISAHAKNSVPITFATAVAILSIFTCAIAALPPAIYAAHRDPVRVLRTP